MKDITLTFKVEEVNLLLTALGNLPFIQVHELIGKIQAQASAQLAAAVNGNGNVNGNGRHVQAVEMETN